LSKTTRQLAPDSLFEQLFQIQLWPARQTKCAVLRQYQDSLSRYDWSIQWDKYSLQERTAFLEYMPQWFGFYTSGHTGIPRLWLRHRQQILAEIALLRELYAETVDGVVTFAPLHHFYGFLCSFLLPLLSGIPVWFQPVSSPSFITATNLSHPLYITIPGALPYLENDLLALKAYNHVTVIYSTAWLPPAGIRLLERLGQSFRLVELFGSTETGLIATRIRPGSEDASWHLAPDVTFTNSQFSRTEEVSLEIQSPRIAWNEEGDLANTWKSDDFVYILDNRRFDFHGRRNSLVKVNGQRVHLTYIEEILRLALSCNDLACIVRQDDLRGEDFDVLIEPNIYTPSLPEVQRICFDTLANLVRPHQVKMVKHIERSSNGKLLLNSITIEEVL